MSLLGLIRKNGPSGYGFNTTAEEVTDGMDLSGQAFLITGCGTGLGLETARVLSKRGAFIIAANRSEARCQETLDAIEGEGAIAVCDLSSLTSVEECCRHVRGMGQKLQGIICNAGIMAPPKLEMIDGVEAQFYVNHLSHFKLVTSLMDLLSVTGRVVVLSSMAHRFTVPGGVGFHNLDGSRWYQAWPFYGQSKLAGLLFARSLAEKLGPEQKAFALHPGVIMTNLGRYLTGFMKLLWSISSVLISKDIPRGAATQVFAATSPWLNDRNGEYLSDCNLKTSSRHGLNKELARKLWEWSEARVKV